MALTVRKSILDYQEWGGKVFESMIFNLSPVKLLSCKMAMLNAHFEGRMGGGYERTLNTPDSAPGTQ